MVTLEEHIENLSRYCAEDKSLIRQAILRCPMIMDDDSLLCYFIEENPWGNTMMITQTDGDGEKIWKWIQGIAYKHHCVAMYCITQRWRPICRKYKFEPIGVLCKKEVN